MLTWARLLLVLLVAGQWVLQLVGERAVDFWWGASIHGAASLCFVFLCYRVAQGAYRPGFREALLIAVALRALALPLEPALSDDVYRYVHEGSMVRAGENPYLVAPRDAPEALRHPGYHERINHPEIPAAYPPAVQYALVLGVTIHPSPLGMKLLFGFLDLMVFVVLWWFLPRIDVPSCRAVVHGYCPLMALEFAGEGHSDSLAVLFLVVALWVFSVGQRHLGAACLAVATAGKLLPAVFLPFLARRHVLVVPTFALVLGALYLPFLLDPAIRSGERGVLELFAGTWQYGDRWRANASIFEVAYAGAKALLHQLEAWGYATGVQDFPERLPARLAKVPIAVLGAALLALAWLWRWPLHKAMAAFFMFFVACTPVLHPWYLAFLVPFLCIYPNLGWLTFTGTIYLAYHVLPHWILMRVWEERLGIKVAEYVPFYLGFVMVLFDRSRGSRTDRVDVR